MQKQRFPVPDVVRHIILAWLLAVLTEYLLLPGWLRNLALLDGLAKMSLLRVAGITCALTLLLFALSRFVNTVKFERWGIAAAFAALAVTALAASFTWAFLAVCVLILTALVVYAVYGWKNDEIPAGVQKKPRKLCSWITAGLSLAFFLFVSVWTVCRVYSFSTPTYDFGIFAQMFHSMKETGLPMTTLERDGLLSHFAVHVSPIYYLMLPFYWLFPVPATLQVLQAAVLASAVIPLWRLGGQHGLSGPARMLCCALLLLYPAYAGGTSYDIHENCFLTPLLLWLLCGIDRKHTAMTMIFAVLTLMVKEDAAVYVAVAALWLLLKAIARPQKDKWELTVGTVMLALAVGWFLAVTGYLAKYGDGVMTSRYRNFMYDGSSSLVTVIKSVILSPMKAVYECVDKEKLTFIALTLLPLLGLPLLTRRYERYILLIPYILVNLMSDYTYQHDIFFQYTYGSTAFLLYLTIVNLAELKLNWQRVLALTMAVVVSTACFGEKVIHKAAWYPKKAVLYYDQYQQIRDALAQIPGEASVTATAFYTTCLSNRQILYDVKYCTQAHLLETQYVILDPTLKSDYSKYASEQEDGGKGDDGYGNLVLLLEENGYQLRESVGDTLVIYHKE